MRALRDAVMAALSPALSGAVFGSYGAAGGLDRYAVVFVARSRKERPRHTSGQSRDRFTVTVHSVGVTEDLCLWVEGVVNGLTGRTLTVSGRRVWPVEFVTGRPPDLDDGAPRPLWFAVSQFDIVSDPV